jgi:putative MATE family efflux protein
MDETVKIPENIMGTLSENKLLLKISLPLIFSMLVQAFYNVVDSYFVAKISENALTAVTLAFPVQNLMIGVGVGTGIGMNALLSRRLGQKNRKAANAAAMNGLLLSAVNTLVFMVFGIFFAGRFFGTQTEIAEIAAYGTDYLAICTAISFGVLFDFTFSRLLQSTGLTLHAMIGQIAGALTNIVLDPIMIFGLVGFPALGVAGAAYATVIGQIVSMCMDMAFNFFANKEIRLKLRGFRPDFRVIGRIYSVGVPAILNSTLFSVFTFGMNRILAGFATSATAVMGVYFKLQSFVFMPVFGLNSGMIPIVAYNFGAGRPDRIRKTVRLGLMYATGIMLAGVLLFQLIPEQILSLFLESPDTLLIGISALKTISLGFVFSASLFIFSAVFQALGHGLHALLVQTVRQLAGTLPLAYLFSRSGNVNLIWWALPCAEVLAAATALLLFRPIHKNQLSSPGADGSQEA